MSETPLLISAWGLCSPTNCPGKLLFVSHPQTHVEIQLSLQAGPRTGWAMAGADLLNKLMSVSRNRMTVLGSSPFICLSGALIGLSPWSPREATAVLLFMLQGSLLGQAEARLQMRWSSCLAPSHVLFHFHSFSAEKKDHPIP